MPIRSLAEILKSQEKRLPFRVELRASRVCHEVRAWIATTWGKDVADEFVRDCFVREGELSLGVASSAFAEELRLRKQELSLFLRQQLPKQSVAHIRIFVSSSYCDRL